MDQFDLVIIGGGPGGYQAAIEGTKAGLSVALVEKEHVGGVCLNWGCIPTKSLLSAAKFYDKTKKAHAFGVEIPSTKFSWLNMLERKDGIVLGLRTGMEGQLNRCKVKVYKGEGRLSGDHIVSISGSEEIGFKKLIIATGSAPRPFPGVEFDRKLFLSSDDLLNLGKVPEHLVIIGGGVIGCEYATLFHTLGSKITILELMDEILPLMDSDLGKRLAVSFRRRGMDVRTGVSVKGLVKQGNLATVQVDQGEAVQGDAVLISIGRIARSQNLGLEEYNIKLDGPAIQVNEHLETSAPDVYAIGDVTTLPQLAHVASFSGSMIVKGMTSGKKLSFPSHAVPSCVFTEPLIASVGMTKKQAEENGSSAIEKRVLLSSQGKAHVEGEFEGFVKLTVCEKTRKVIGGHVMGGEASEVIGALSVAVSAGVTIDQLSNTIFSHPTYHELIGNAAKEF